MYRTENEKLLSSIGVRILRKRPIYSDLDVVGCINGFFVYKRNYYWVVKGKMPIKVANEIYKFSLKYGIRAEGILPETDPKDVCTSDKYEDYIYEISQSNINSFEDKSNNIEMDFNEFDKKLKTKRNELFKENKDDFYISTYHIDDYFGLQKVVEIIKRFNIKTEW